MMRVLVVEDNKALRSVLCAALRDCGCAPIGFTTGEQAIREARRQPFDVLLFDLVLPGIGGLAVFAALRAENPKLIGIGMSGIRTDPTTARVVEQHGAIAFLIKPFDVASLRSVIEAYAAASCPGLIGGTAGLLAGSPDIAERQSTRREMLQALVNAACVRDLCGLCFSQVADLIRSVIASPVAVINSGREPSKQHRCINTVRLDARARQAIQTVQVSGMISRQRTVAVEIGVSVSHLGRLVRQSGMSYLDWVRAPKLKRALGDVVWSDKQMKVIASDSGFSSTSSLDRAFNRSFGVSPSALRGWSRGEL